MSAYRRVLRFHNFRYLFLGQAASFIGDQVVIVALALFVTQLTGSPTDLGLVFGVQAVPLVLLLLFGGVWADRLPRHQIMIATDVTRAVLHATLALLIFTGAVRIWQVILIEALFGAAEAFFRPAYTGLIPQTVPEELINDANSLTHAVDNLSLLVGPAIATALVVGVGPGEAFAFDAATFVLSAVLLMRVRPRRRGEPEPSASVLHELRVGWREVSERAWVWVTIVVFSGALFCALAPWIVLGPTIAREVYGATSVFGVLSAMVGAGALAGSLAAVRWRPRRPLRAGLLLMLAWPLYDCAFALGAPLWVLGPMAIAMGVGWALMGVWWETALARHIPPHALSRVSSYDWMGSLVLLPLGYVLAGPLASLLGARTVLGVGGAIGLGLVAVALLPRETRELSQEPEPDLGGEARARQRAMSPGLQARLDQ
ncbi:MAG: MFS transporter [Solirubrobacteraceae bacterium]